MKRWQKYKISNLLLALLLCGALSVIGCDNKQAAEPKPEDPKKEDPKPVVPKPKTADLTVEVKSVKNFPDGKTDTLTISVDLESGANKGSTTKELPSEDFSHVFKGLAAGKYKVTLTVATGKLNGTLEKSVELKEKTPAKVTFDDLEYEEAAPDIQAIDDPKPITPDPKPVQRPVYPLLVSKTSSDTSQQALPMCPGTNNEATETTTPAGRTICLVEDTQKLTIEFNKIDLGDQAIALGYPLIRIKGYHPYNPIPANRKTVFSADAKAYLNDTQIDRSFDGSFDSGGDLLYCKDATCTDAEASIYRPTNIYSSSDAPDGLNIQVINDTDNKSKVYTIIAEHDFFQLPKARLAALKYRALWNKKDELNRSLRVYLDYGSHDPRNQVFNLHLLRRNDAPQARIDWVRPGINDNVDADLKIVYGIKEPWDEDKDLYNTNNDPKTELFQTRTSYELETELLDTFANVNNFFGLNDLDFPTVFSAVNSSDEETFRTGIDGGGLLETTEENGLRYRWKVYRWSGEVKNNLPICDIEIAELGRPLSKDPLLHWKFYHNPASIEYYMDDPVNHAEPVDQYYKIDWPKAAAENHYFERPFGWVQDLFLPNNATASKGLLAWGINDFHYLDRKDEWPSEINSDYIEDNPTLFHFATAVPGLYRVELQVTDRGWRTADMFIKGLEEDEFNQVWQPAKWEDTTDNKRQADDLVSTNIDSDSTFVGVNGGYITIGAETYPARVDAVWNHNRDGGDKYKNILITMHPIIGDDQDDIAELYRIEKNQKDAYLPQYPNSSSTEVDPDYTVQIKLYNVSQASKGSNSASSRCQQAHCADKIASNEFGWVIEYQDKFDDQYYSTAANHYAAEMYIDELRPQLFNDGMYTNGIVRILDGNNKRHAHGPRGFSATFESSGTRDSIMISGALTGFLRDFNQIPRQPKQPKEFPNVQTPLQ